MRIISPFIDYYDSVQKIQYISGYEKDDTIYLRKPIPEIPDKVILEAKGFDKKTSFRKPKSNSK